MKPKAWIDREEALGIARSIGDVRCCAPTCKMCWPKIRKALGAAYKAGQRDADATTIQRLGVSP